MSHPHDHSGHPGAQPELHEHYGPEARYAVAAEARLPTTKWEEEIARGLELGLPGADSIVDRRIPTFSRGELPHFAGINTFLKAPYVEDVRKCGAYDVAVLGAPFDGGTTYRSGTRFGPQGIRKISALYGPYSFELGVDLRESRRISNDALGWFAGWFMLIGYIVSVSAIAIALQTVLPSVWSGFQLVSGSSALTTKSGATNAILIGTVVIVISTVIGNIGVGIMSRITRIGVTCELVGVALLIVLFFVHAKRGPGAVFHTNGVAGRSGYLWPFMISALMACYVMYGFDSAGELSEETRNPREAAPQGIIRAMLASGVGGALLLVGALLAAPSLLSPALGTEGLAYVIQTRLGTGLGKVLLVDVSIAILSAALAIQASASRVMFSMARDGRLPFSRRLAHVSPRRGTPAAPNIVVGALAIALLVVNLGQSALFTDITGVAVVVVYLAYLGVTVPRLVARFKPGFTERERASGTQFSLGRLGLPLNIIAVVFGTFFLVDIGWPRAIVYGTSGYLHYFSLIFVGGCALLGIVSYLRVKQRDRLQVAQAVDDADIDLRMDPA